MVFKTVSNRRATNRKMRAKEFLTEREYKEIKSDPMIYSQEYPSMPSSNPYLIYRFSMAMADHTMDHVDGPAAQNAIVAAFTKEDEEIIKGAERQTGHKGRTLSDKKSTEPTDTNKTSPVAKPKRNKYGV